MTAYMLVVVVVVVVADPNRTESCVLPGRQLRKRRAPWGLKAFILHRTGAGPQTKRHTKTLRVGETNAGERARPR